MHRASSPPGSTQAEKAAAKAKRAAPRSDAKEGPLEASSNQRSVQISIFDFAVSIGVRLFPEAEPSAPKPRRQHTKPAK